MLTTTYDGAERPSTVSGSLNGNATNYVTKSAYWPQGAIYYFVRGNGLWSAAGCNDRLQPSELYQATNNVNSTGNASSTGNMLFYSCLDWGVTEGFNNSLYPLCNPTNTKNDNGTLLHYSEYYGGSEYPQYLSFTQTFTYDGANRLAAASEGSNWSRNFGYDQYGNMWVAGSSGSVPLAGNTPQSPSSFNANDQITTGNASFDAAGNQTVLNGDTLAYDAENRMTSAYDPIMHSTETYVYDGNGQRVQKSGPGGTTTYVYDAFGNLAAEYGAAPSAPCTTCYLSYDHLGSVRLVTDQNGNVVARHDYLPFGEEIPANTAGRNGQWGSTADVDTKFTGQIRDTETGMDYFNARYFTSALGRFNSPDPENIGADPLNPQSWNGYSYVMNDPLALVDPAGTDTCANGQYADACVTAPEPPDVPVISIYWPWPTGGGPDQQQPTETTPPPTRESLGTFQLLTQPPNYVPTANPGNCVAGYTAAGAGLGAAAGYWAGGGAGALGGGAVGTAIEPGGGTAVGAFGGFQVGSEVGAAGGFALGARAGYLLGNIACSSRSGNGGDYRDKTRRANANDKQQIRNVAREEGVDPNRFGKWLEMEKRAEGRSPSDNYTYGELKELARIYKSEGGR